MGTCSKLPYGEHHLCPSPSIVWNGFILFSICLYIFVGGRSDFLLTCEVYIFSIYKPSFEILPTRKVICIHVFDILIANTYFQDISHYMGGCCTPRVCGKEGRSYIFSTLPINSQYLLYIFQSYPNNARRQSPDISNMKNKNLNSHNL